MASTTLLNNRIFRSSTSHPDLSNVAALSTNYDSLIRHKLETSGQAIQSLGNELRLEKEKNRILEAQVSSLEGVIAQLLSQAEQYNYEAILNEKRVKDLEAKLDKEVSKRHAHVKTVHKLENAVDRVKMLEKQLKVQIDMRTHESLNDDQLAWSVVETNVLRNKVKELQKDVTLNKLQKAAIVSEVPLDTTSASDAVELALIKDRLAIDLKYEASASGPSEDYAVCVVENFALKEQVRELAGVQAIREAEMIQSEAEQAQIEVVHEQLEQIKTLEAQFVELSAACDELQSRRSSVVPSEVASISIANSFNGLDEQLAYALVENKFLRERL
jgi:hypothetical protein